MLKIFFREYLSPAGQPIQRLALGIDRIIPQEILQPSSAFVEFLSGGL